jgi:hypothetical protein
MRKSSLLAIDAVINFILGILLVLTIPYPNQIYKIFGVPEVADPFYPSLLGAVLIGIGFALLVEVNRTNPRQFVGLGLGGAVAINLCAGAVLIGWLIFGNLQLPLIGMLFLWGISLILVAISGVELVTHFRDKNSA